MHTCRPFSLLFLAVHSMPRLCWMLGTTELCQAWACADPPLEGPNILAAQMGLSKEVPEVKEGFLEVGTQAEALAPLPP